MKNSLLISGSGGQGVVSAGVMLAESAAESGKYATCLPEYGPEQRGGSAKCTVIISDREIISPLPKKFMNFIALNEQGFKKFSPQIRENGLMVLNSNRVNSEAKREDVKVIFVPADDIASEIGNVKISNIIMIGALIGAAGIISEEAFLESIAKKFSGKNPQIVEMNAAALKKGVAIGKSQID